MWPARLWAVHLCTTAWLSATEVIHQRQFLCLIALTCFDNIWPIRRGRSHDFVFRRFPILVLRKLWSFKVIVWAFFTSKAKYITTAKVVAQRNVSKQNWFPRFIMNLIVYLVSCNFVTVKAQVTLFRDYGFVLEQNGVIGLGKSIQNTGEQLLSPLEENHNIRSNM